MEKRRLSSYYGMFARRKWREEMLNIEKYKDEIKAEIEKDKTLGCVVNKLMGNKCDYYPKCNDCYLKVLDWLLEEYKDPILSANEVYLQFKYEGEYFNTLSFNKYFRFQGMEINEKYTLKDLGLC